MINMRSDSKSQTVCMRMTPRLGDTASSDFGDKAPGDLSESIHGS